MRLINPLHERRESMKKTVLLVGIYLEGIYPRGDYSVEPNLLAPAFLKASADSDPLINAKYNIKILNLPASYSGKEIAERIGAENPYAVGYSVYIWNFDLMHSSSKILRDSLPNVKIFLGGPEVSFTSFEVMNANPQIDFIVCGNGETRFKDLLRNDLKPNIPGTPGITYKDNDGSIRQSKEGHIQEDLSKIPSPYQTGVINLNDGKRHCVFIETFRGCIFECGYCMWMGEQAKKKLNLYPISQILKDIELIYNSPNVAAVVFTDACIFYTRERAQLILDKIAECQYKIPTTFTLDIAFMDEEAVRALKEIQLSHQKFHFGMQSINQETLKLMNRRIGAKLFKKRIDMLRRVDPDIEISFDLIYGLPGDNFSSFRDTVDFALNLSPIKLNMSPLVLLPGSAYWMQKDRHEFVYELEAPHLVHSNRTYTAEDMRKTRKLVLGLIMLMYFPAIRNTIYKLTEDEIDKDSENKNASAQDEANVDSHNSGKRGNTYRRIELVEMFIEMFEKQSSILLDIVSISNRDQYSPREYNYVRKHIMDEVAKPINGLFAYQVILEILGLVCKDNTKLIDILNLGIDFYDFACQKGTQQAQRIFAQKHGNELVEQIMYGWVVSSELESENESGVPKEQKTGGVGAVC